MYHNLRIKTAVPTFLLVLLFPTAARSQEICDNGIDDDADGLVDLQDTMECACSIALDTFNLLLNPSFEEYDGTCRSAYPTGLPSSFGLADCIADWVSPTGSSPDAYNLLGYAGNPVARGPMPVPDGTGYFGIVGQLGSGGPDDFFHEYLGTCLKDGGIEAGTEYNFSFQMAAREEAPGTAYVADNAVTIWGARTCEDLRITSTRTGCAEQIGNDWVRITSVTAPFVNDSSWSPVSVDFTAAEDFAAIVVGIDCQQGLVLPPGLAAAEAYYFFDDMRLAPSTAPPPAFGPVSIASAGGCNPTVELSVLPLPTATLQWYANGIALTGEISPTLTTTAISDSFTVRALLPDGSCTLTPPVVPGPFVRDTMRAVNLVQICDSMPPPDGLSLFGLSATRSNIVWSTGETTPSIDTDTVGTYTVAYEDGCFFIERTFEMVPAVRPAFPITVTPATFCPGDTVVVTIEASDSFNTVTLFRQINGSPATLQAEQSDTLVVPSDDSIRYQIGFSFSSCLLGGLEDFVIGSAAPEVDFLLNSPPCPGEAGSIIPVVTSGPTAPLDYAWSTLAGVPLTMDSVLTDVPAASYVLTVSGDCGTVFIDTLMLVESVQPVIESADVTDEDCATAGSGGRIESVVVSGVSPAATLVWFSSAGDSIGNGTSLTGLGGGDYRLVVTDGPCTVDSLFTIATTSTVLPTFDFSFSPPPCPGETGSITPVVTSGPTAPLDYAWSTLAGVPLTADSVLTDVPAASYVLTVSGDCGPLRTDTLVLTALDFLAVILDESAASGCGSASVIATTFPASTDYTYTWTDADGNPVGTDSTFTSDTSGRFEVVLTFGAGCTTPALSSELTVADPAVVSAVVTNAGCGAAGAGGGIDNVVVSGISPAATLRWFSATDVPLGSGNSLVGLAAGDYRLEVTDGACVLDTVFTVAATSSEIPALDFSLSPICPGETGSITPVVTSGPTAPLDYAWSTLAGVPLTADSVLTDVPAASYVLTVSGDCGPLRTDTLVLTALDFLAVILDESAASGCGSASVIATTFPASTDYTYTWTDADGNPVGTDSTFTSDTSGRFEVVLTFGAGCTTPALSSELTVADPAVVSAVVTNAGCGAAGAGGGIDNVVVSGISPAATLRWFFADGTPLSTEEAVDDLPAGNYLLVVSDGSCTVDSLFTISQSGVLEGLSLQVDRPATCNRNGRLVLTGSLPEYAVNWRDETGTAIASDSVALTVTSGSYTVIVTDPAGCTDTLAVTLAAPTVPTLTVSLGGSADSCLISAATAASANRQLILNASGGTPPYSFSVDGGPFEATAVRLLPVGTTVTVEVRDAGGCVGEPLVRSIPLPDFLTLTVSPDVVIEAGTSTTLRTDLLGGPATTATIAWSPVEGLSCADCPQPIARPDSSTTYVVTYTLFPGCRLRDSVSVTVALLPQPQRIYLPTAFSPNGDGLNDTFRAFVANDVAASISTLEIYDRWGGLLYTLDDPQLVTEFVGWDGTGRNGKALPPGVFTYVMSISLTEGQREVVAGEVTLVR